MEGDVAPTAALHVPLAHRAHVLAAVAYAPAGQGPHAVAPAADASPPAHGTHAVAPFAPVTALADPAAHSVQRPFAAANDPAAQAVGRHCVPFAEYPAGHAAEHDVAPAGDTVPAAHVRVHGDVAPDALEKVPAAHGAQRPLAAA